MRRNFIDKRNRVLITAGPTRERIDPVRFISNYATGTFGFEIAEEARRRGNPVTLISGPVNLKIPAGIRFIPVESAMEMRRAVLKEFPRSDCVIMAAAVSDWRVSTIAKKKIKRGRGKLRLELVENADILRELGALKRDKALVGFALETEDLEKNAVKKLKEKNLDLIIVNKTGPGSGAFGGKKIDILMIDRFGNKIGIFNRSKRELAKIILDKVEEFNI